MVVVSLSYHNISIFFNWIISKTQLKIKFESKLAVYFNCSLIPLCLTCIPWLEVVLWCVVCLSPDGESHNASITDPHALQAVPGTSPQGKVNPYSVIDITPLQPQLLEQNHSPPASASSPTEPKEREGEVPESRPSPMGVTSGYSVPVPCGYATPSGVPLITPAYTTPVIIRHLSVEEDGKVEPAAVTAVTFRLKQSHFIFILKISRVL